MSFSSSSSTDSDACVCHSFTWYKDEKEKEKVFVFSLDGLKLRDITGLTARKHSFALFHVQGKNVFRDMRQVRVQAI